MRLQRVLELIVGLFMIVGVLCLLFLAFKVSGLTTWSHANTYKINAAFQNIGDLKVRAPVTIAGVRIGEVTQIKLDPVTYEAQVTMRLEKGEQIPVDSTANIYTAGLIGANYISITPGFENVFLKNNEQLERTNQAMILQNIIGQLLYSFKSDSKDKTTSDSAKVTLPKGTTYNYAGESRQYVQEGSALVVTLFFAILVIFLILSAQFESFRDPFVILISVPMSICGALIPLNLGFASINIYTQIGLITLVGLISKHGILMVEFANNIQRDEGLSIRAAMEKAASIRLRPVLMTTFSMVFGVVPLLIATGAGAESRFCIGLVIASGMMIGTMFTLFVVPTMYTFIAKDHSKTKSDDL